MGGIMELTWFGTAGFRIKTGQLTILIDPHFTRNEKALPAQWLKFEFNGLRPGLFSVIM